MENSKDQEIKHLNHQWRWHKEYHVCQRCGMTEKYVYPHTPPCITVEAAKKIMRTKRTSYWQKCGDIGRLRALMWHYHGRGLVTSATVRTVHKDLDIARKGAKEQYEVYKQLFMEKESPENDGNT